VMIAPATHVRLQVTGGVSGTCQHGR